MPEIKPINPSPGNVPTDFTVHQLAVFHAVAQRLSYTRAAEALYLSQPAVTQQVRTLELALGLRLFVRSGRGIVLTPAGQELLQHTERLLALLAETAPVVQEIHTLERGSVLVGASTSAGTYVAPSLLGTFHTRYPRVRIMLKVANRRTIEECLLTHEVDLAVISLIERPDRFVVEFLMPYELVVVTTPSHRLVGRPTLGLRDLQQETFLLGEQGSGTRLDTEQHFAHTGVP
ncbi:MAG TPA: LysR substrate-binding domain-containing protein, partial [Ktedonobacteraceae bacterium]